MWTSPLLTMHWAQISCCPIESESAMPMPSGRVEPATTVRATTRTRATRRPVLADVKTYLYAAGALLLTTAAEDLLSRLLGQLHL